MKYGFQVFLAIASTASLISLCSYIVMALRGKNELFFHIPLPHYFSWTHKLFLLLATAGFALCLGSGALAMLWWVPGGWWHTQMSDGPSPRDLIGGLFGFLGVAAAIAIGLASRDQFLHRLAKEKVIEYEKLLEVFEWKNAETRAHKLEVCRKELEAKYSAVSAEAYRDGGSYVSDHSFEGVRAEQYRWIVFQAKQLESRTKEATLPSQ